MKLSEKLMRLSLMLMSIGIFLSNESLIKLTDKEIVELSKFVQHVKANGDGDTANGAVFRR